MMRVVDVDNLLSSKKPFTALFVRSKFYVVYRLGGARSDKWLTRGIRVAGEKYKTGPLDFFKCGFDSEDPS